MELHLCKNIQSQIYIRQFAKNWWIAEGQVSVDARVPRWVWHLREVWIDRLPREDQAIFTDVENNAEWYVPIGHWADADTVGADCLKSCLFGKCKYDPAVVLLAVYIAEVYDNFEVVSSIFYCE